MGVAHVGGGGRLGNLLGSTAVLAVAAAIAVGLPALDRSLPASRPVPAGQRYQVGGGVSVVPPPGAELDVTKTRPQAARGTVLFLVGSVRYVIVVAPFTGSVKAAGDRLRRKITSTRGYQVTGPERPVTFGASLTGLGGGYSAPGRVGRYLVFLAYGKAIEITVSGTRADLSGVLARVEDSVRTLTCRAVR